MLRRALAPVEPPEHLRVRMEETLNRISDLAADELDAWELTALHDPRTWVRPVAAIAIGTAAAGAAAVLQGRRRRAGGGAAPPPTRLTSPPARCARSPTRSSAASAASP